MHEPVDWVLLYRSPLAATKGVDEKIVRTNSEDPVIAEVVARFWLSRERAHPSTKFISLVPAVAMTENKMHALQKATAPSPVESPEPEAAASAGRGEQIGAVEDHAVPGRRSRVGA